MEAAQGGSWHSECERREGETSAWLMGGRVEKHFSHSFGTPLQSTSDLLEVDKRGWGLSKRENKQPSSRCQVC